MRTLLVVLLFLLIAAPPRRASAQVFGPEIVWGDESDIGVGARVEFDIGVALTSSGPLSEAALTGSFDYFFPDCDAGFAGEDCSYWEVHSALLIPVAAASIDPYVGAGLHLAHASFDVDAGEFGGSASDSEVGIDLLGGLRFPVGAVSAFTELRLQLGGGEQFEIAGGLLFGQR